MIEERNLRRQEEQPQEGLLDGCVKEIEDAAAQKRLDDKLAIGFYTLIAVATAGSLRLLKPDIYADDVLGNGGAALAGVQTTAAVYLAAQVGKALGQGCADALGLKYPEPRRMMTGLAQFIVCGAALLQVAKPMVDGMSREIEKERKAGQAKEIRYENPPRAQKSQAAYQLK